MDTIVERYNKIKSNINNDEVNIVAVSKMFTLDHIMPLVDHGHLHFGENKVQEAESKWKNIMKTNKNLKLHMVGKLQSNKAKKAVEVFDFIHSLDNQKLADGLKKSEINMNKKLKYFIQVNVGNENQKSGIPASELDSFYTYCKNEIDLDIIGLMSLPPNNVSPDKYFKYLYEANTSLALKDLSIGMSSDYKKAVEYKSTYVRIGSLLFGERPNI
jgi:pyridoxal phosphate enzyme (YggS family)